jgi:hypothetical protein
VSATALGVPGFQFKYTSSVPPEPRCHHHSHSVSQEPQDLCVTCAVAAHGREAPSQGYETFIGRLVSLKVQEVLRLLRDLASQRSYLHS